MSWRIVSLVDGAEGSAPSTKSTAVREVDMARETLRAALGQLDETMWRSSGCGGASVDWLPLVSISESGLWLGIGREGDWILGRLQGSVVSSTLDQPVPLPWLTLLDMSESDFQERLDGAARRYGLSPGDLREMVPTDDILALGLRSKSTHWVECATRWLVGRPLREDHIYLLRDASTSRWASQWTRQTARKLIAASQS